VQDWIVAPYTEDYYSFDNFAMTAFFAKCAYGALDRMDAEGTDWSIYDQDGDGVLDAVVILHSGYVAEGGGTDCINNKTHGDHRIWSHATSVQDNSDAWHSADRSVRIGVYSTSSAVRGTCGSDIQRIGIVGHEMLHMLGLPDLLGRPGTGVGIWDVMGQCWGADGTLLYPSTIGPWCRQYVGWL
jgi:M6 family metalloprotease-like protein